MDPSSSGLLQEVWDLEGPVEFLSSSWDCIHLDRDLRFNSWNLLECCSYMGDHGCLHFPHFYSFYLIPCYFSIFSHSFSLKLFSSGMAFFSTMSGLLTIAIESGWGWCSVQWICLSLLVTSSSGFCCLNYPLSTSSLGATFLMHPWIFCFILDDRSGAYRSSISFLPLTVQSGCRIWGETLHELEGASLVLCQRLYLILWPPIT